MKGSKELALQSVLSLGIPRDLQLVYTGEKETAGPEREAQAPLGPNEAGPDSGSQDLKGSAFCQAATQPLQSPEEVCVQPVRDLGLELERRNERAADGIC